MKITETADIVGFIWDVNGWNLSDRTVKAWHTVIGDLDHAAVKAALVKHMQESSERITPAHLRKAAATPKSQPDIYLDENGVYKRRWN